jgi:hypothetical protein
MSSLVLDRHRLRHHRAKTARLGQPRDGHQQVGDQLNSKLIKVARDEATDNRKACFWIPFGQPLADLGRFLDGRSSTERQTPERLRSG